MSTPHAAAATLRTELFGLVAAVMAHQVSPPSGALWVPPRRGAARAALAADDLAASAATAGAPPHQEQSLGRTGGGPSASLSLLCLLLGPAAAKQREVSLPLPRQWRRRRAVHAAAAVSSVRTRNC